VGKVFVPTRIESKFILCFANVKLILMSGFGPTAEILFFACPKKSIQKKGHPMPLVSYAPAGLSGVFGRAIHSPPKTRGIPAAPLSGNSRSNPSVLGAASGD